MECLNWKNGFFSNTYTLFSGTTPIGELRNKSLSMTAYGEINGKKILFRTKGILKQETEIIDKETKELLGRITYNTWMTKGIIELGDRKNNWKFDNLRNTRWRISDTDENLNSYVCTTTSGTIQQGIEDDILTLAGLYIHNYNAQMSLVVIVAVFLPIWLTVLM